MKRVSRRILTLVTCCCMAFLAIPTLAYADADGTEIQITDHPEQLVIQLGQEWAGVEFELKTDAGLYPQPIVVDETGILKMELGGSQTYTLSAMNSTVPAPSASATQNGKDNDENAPVILENNDVPNQETASESEESSLIKGIPNTHLFLFGGGLIVCVGALIAMRVLKQRRSSQEDTEEYDDFEE